MHSKPTLPLKTLTLLFLSALQAGFATFVWDKPGTGESTGKLSEPNLQHKRAQILLDAIELMTPPRY